MSACRAGTAASFPSSGPEKIAVVESALVITSVQVGPDPAQAPRQSWKAWPVPAAAVRVTTVVVGRTSLQSATQAMPAGDEDTRPRPSVATDRR